MMFSRGGQQKVDKAIGWFQKAWCTKKAERGQWHELKLEKSVVPRSHKRLCKTLNLL